MKKEEFEKEFNKLAKDTKACILIRMNKDAEFPWVGCQGDPKEIIWSMVFTLSQILVQTCDDKKNRKELTKHVQKMLKNLVEDSNEDTNK